MILRDTPKPLTFYFFHQRISSRESSQAFLAQVHQRPTVLFAAVTPTRYKLSPSTTWRTTAGVGL